MNSTCCPLYTIKCEAVNFKPSKSQKKVIKKFVNYILSDKRPGTGMSDTLEDNHVQEEDDGENVEESRGLQVEKELGLKNLHGIKNLTERSDEPENLGNQKMGGLQVDNYHSSSEVDVDEKVESTARKKVSEPKGEDMSKPKQVKAKIAFFSTPLCYPGQQNCD